MALIDSTLQGSITTIFNSMRNMTSGGDTYLSKQLAVAIKTFILTAEVETVDSGSASGGTYAGKGTGTPGCFVIDNATLETALYSTFTAKNVTDTDIGNGIANNINEVCTKQNLISTKTSGLVTLPNGASSELNGTGKGTFTSDKSIISQKLLGKPGVPGTFEKMRNMTSGGDDLFANDLASAIGSYLRAGTVSVTLNTPISGSGSGGVK